MIISKHNNYIKLESSLIQDIISNPGSNESIEVSGNINCCTENCGEQLNTETISIEDNGKWFVDLTSATELENTISALKLRHILNGQDSNVITAPIDLGYVADNCATEDCTLQTYSGYFAPLFKSQIDAWFAGIGITSNVTVTFEDSVMIVEDIPDGFILTYATYTTGNVNVDIPFGFSILDSNFFVANDSLYVKPEFFGLTELMDGIYKFTVKIVGEDAQSSVTETNCAFIDVTTKCKVAALIQNIISESKESNSEQCSMTAHLLHYALVNGSNCACNCEELCQVYRELVSLLTTVDPQTLNDCGC